MERAYDPAAHAQAPDWIAPAARLGFLAKAAVYMIIGALAIEVAHEGATQSMGTKGAIATIAQQPLGEVLLWVTALGLFCYAMWRLTQAFMDPDGDGTDAKGMGKRIAYGASGVAHIGLAFAAVTTAMGSSSSGSGGGGSAQDWTATLMQSSWGHWLVGLIGVGIGIAAIAQAVRAYTASFMRKMEPDMSADERKWTRRAGRAGHAARAVVFAIMAYFLLNAAMTSNAQQVVGLDGALRELAQQGHGTFVLSITAVGLFLYGAFMAVKARYRALPE